MKLLKYFSLSLLFFFSTNVLLIAQGTSKAGSRSKNDNLVSVQFKDTDSIFANPGQGWMSSRFPSSIKYVRLNWADVEPEKGKYDWSPFEKAINAGKQRGIKISIRIMTCNAHSSGYYSSPKWLFDEGCKGHEYLRGGADRTSGGERIPRIEPDYSDPIYLLRHGEFLKALGQKYNGTPDVEFLDIGSYGIWGEWHTSNPAPVEVRRKIVDMYIAAFPNTPLVFMSDDAEVLPYALEKGTGMRRDGIGSRSHERNWIGTGKYVKVTAMADAWKQAPIVFEWFGDYEYLLSRGWSYDSAVNFMLRNHVTVLNDNVGKVPPDKMPQLYKLAKLAGARFVLNEMNHVKSIKAGSDLTVSMKWVNTGVGKLYQPYNLRFFFTDSKNNVVFTADGQCDPKTWLPGEQNITESFQIPGSTKKGTYKLAIALVDKSGRRTPFRLAINVPEKDGRYLLSEINIK
jgi:hypothetical protein